MAVHQIRRRGSGWGILAISEGERNPSHSTLNLMNVNDLFDSIKLTEQLALENYNQRNGVVDYRLDGVCNHYFPQYDTLGDPSFKNGEIVLTCKVLKTVKGQLRYTFQINGKRVAEKMIPSTFLSLGAFR